VGLVSIGDKIAEMRHNQRLSLLLAGSAAMRDELILNGFPPARVEILPPVVRMSERAMAQIPAENRILYVGQLIRGKGVDLLLNALVHVKSDFQLTIAGTGNAQTRLEQLSAKLGLGGKVRFAGWVSPQGLGEYYAGAKLVVVPSRWPEPFGMIGLEAMHYGRPVVAFRVGGIPDWLDDGVTGLLAPEQDVRAMAQAIEQLLDNSALCSKLGSQAQTRVRERFSFERYLDKLEAFLSM
jgi:glycosyltransferase involved in cell wall biosynthesis